MLEFVVTSAWFETSVLGQGKVSIEIWNFRTSNSTSDQARNVQNASMWSREQYQILLSVFGQGFWGRVWGGHGRQWRPLELRTARAMAKDYHQPLQPLLLIGLWTIFCYGTKKKEVLLLRVRESTTSYENLGSKIIWFPSSIHKCKLKPCKAVTVTTSSPALWGFHLHEFYLTRILAICTG